MQVSLWGRLGLLLSFFFFIVFESLYESFNKHPILDWCNIILSGSAYHAVVQDHVDWNPPLLHAGYDVIQGRLNGVLSQGIGVGVPLPANPDRPAIEILAPLPLAHPCMPCPVGVLSKDRPFSVSGNQAMVGDFTCGIANPAYPSVVASSAVVEDDGLWFYFSLAFVWGCESRLWIARLGGRLGF